MTLTVWQVFPLHFPSPMRLVQSSVQPTTLCLLNSSLKPKYPGIKNAWESRFWPEIWHLKLKFGNLGLPGLSVMWQSSAWLVDPGQWLAWRLPECGKDPPECRTAVDPGSEKRGSEGWQLVGQICPWHSRAKKGERCAPLSGKTRPSGKNAPHPTPSAKFCLPFNLNCLWKFLTLHRIINIATGKTSQAITPYSICMNIRGHILLWVYRQLIAMSYIALARQAWIYRNILVIFGRLRS